MILRSSANGQIFVCTQCQKIHLEFGNFSYDFTSETKLNNFLCYLQQLNGFHYESLNKSSNYRRKVMVQMPDTGLKLLFTSGELDEIKNLIVAFIDRNNKEFLSARFTKADMRRAGEPGVYVSKIEFDFSTIMLKHLN